MSNNKTEYLKKLGLKIKRYRLQRGMSQDDLADAAGFSGRSSISRIETGTTDISRDKFVLLASALGVNPVELMDVDGSVNINQSVSIPILGSVAAGVPLDMVTDILGYEEIPAHLAGSGEFFALRINGRSMEPAICDGDIVIVRSQNTAVDGDIVIAAVGSELATCKRFEHRAGCYMLIPLNSAYTPQIFPDNSEQELIHIIGRVVECRRKF